MLGIAIIIVLNIIQTTAHCDIYPLNEGSYCDCPNVDDYIEALRNCDNQSVIAIKVHNSDLVDIKFVTDLNVRYITNSTTSLIITNNKELRMEEVEGKNMFYNFPNLTQLVMRQNNLRILSNNVIKENNIVTLDLQHNQFSSIPKIASKTLKNLYLTRNLISSINKDDFENMPALEEIILEDNKLQLVDSNIFLKLRNLKRLYLYTNLWECNCTSVRLFRDLKEVAQTENEIECDIGTDKERILVDANGITDEFVKMCPLGLEKMSEMFSYNGVLKHHQLSFLLVSSTVMYNIL